MKSIKDLLQNKANDIDTSGVRSDVQLIQAEIDRLFDGVEVAKFVDGVATLKTKSSPVASNLRMQQTQLTEDLNSSLKNPIKRLIIRIG